MATPSLVTLSATELRRLIGIKEISPVELLDACIARIEALDPAVNAIAARAFERARTEAIARSCCLAGSTMPFGLQVVGRFGGDIELLDIAGALERWFEGIADLRRPRPDISALATPRPELKSIVTDPPAQP